MIDAERRVVTGRGVAEDLRVRVQIRHLAALVAITNEGSFRGAADRLGYAPSAVSNQLVQLERVVGMRLVKRTRGRASVALTDAGRLLFEHAEVMLERLDAARSELAALVDGIAGTLRIGTFDGASGLLARITPAFAALCPEVRIERIDAAVDADLLGALERDEIDLALCEHPLGRADIASVALVDDPFVLLVAARSPLAGCPTPPSLSEICELPLVGFNDSRSHERAAAALRARGLEPVFRLRSDLAETVQALVGAGAGVAIVPRLAIDPQHPATEAMELPELAPRVIALAWSRQRPPSGPAASFVEASRAASAGAVASDPGDSSPTAHVDLAATAVDA